ncbi:MAG: DUF6067 family protein, partial [Planctomycetota bacterium]|nr:DUF6067 family protein [Planctomycetota bacterium]
EAPPDGRILNRAVPDGTRDIIAAFHDDSIELAIDPKRERKQGARTFYHLITNGRGTLYDRAVNPDNKQNPVDFNWRIPKWELEHQLKDGWWQVEIAIPFESLEVVESDLKLAWGIRIARNWRRPGEQTQWESVGASYIDQPSMPLVSWDAAAPVIQMRSLQEDGAPVIRLSIRNPGAKPLSVKASIADNWHHNPADELKQALAIPPGETREVALKARDGGPEGLHTCRIKVTNSDASKVWFSRHFRWSMHRPKSVWSIGEEQRRAVALQFKYYPSHSKIRLRADIAGLKLKDKVSGARVLIRKLKSTKTDNGIWSHEIRFEKDVFEGVLPIPELDESKYELALFLEGEEGIPDKPVTQAFERKRFEWENNKLGFSDDVIPPFTPLEVNGKTVKCVLREHQHGDSGLWESVKSQGIQILTGPMQWEVDSGGLQQIAASRPWKSTSRKSTEVVGESEWSAGPISARMQTTWDYDGMMLVKLKLRSNGETVDRLSFRIPVKESEARYMHSVGDGLRHNFAGFVPRGKGVVWDSSKANKLNIIGAFFPYVWVGRAERGVCFFADTDRGLSLDDDKPMIELVRRGGTLEMRVHLINRPVAIDAEREIVFGLQVTPTKPMPKGWRRWTATKRPEGARPIRWMGATFYWGGISYDVYPFEKDYSYFDTLKKARISGEWDLQYITAWMKELMKKKELLTRTEENFLAHVRGGMHVARSSPWSKGWRVFGYTNARGVGFHSPEFKTFQDEWLRYAWFNREWSPKGAVGYDVSPSKSFVDFALWYYRKMLVCFDGVYWDNTFLSANYDPVVGNAWQDDKGRWHPGMGLMHLRSLIKRTAVMFHNESKELPDNRKPLLTLSHMTNTMIVPVLSFGNCNMDWEWKYGYEDFQDRFSPDLTVAETIGRQVGAWPTILAGGHPDPKDPRCPHLWRTRLGVCLVHEIQAFNWRPPSDTKLYERLFEFGYGEDGCEVFNYWQAGHPVTVNSNSVDARTIAIAHKAKALIVVTDYGEGGECNVNVQTDKLGIRKDASAKDFETGEAVEGSAASSFKLVLQKHDYRILVIE